MAALFAVQFQGTCSSISQCLYGNDESIGVGELLYCGLQEEVALLPAPYACLDRFQELTCDAGCCCAQTAHAITRYQVLVAFSRPYPLVLPKVPYDSWCPCMCTISSPPCGCAEPCRLPWQRLLHHRRPGRATLHSEPGLLRQQNLRHRHWHLQHRPVR